MEHNYKITLKIYKYSGYRILFNIILIYRILYIAILIKCIAFNHALTADLLFHTIPESPVRLLYSNISNRNMNIFPNIDKTTSYNLVPRARDPPVLRGGTEALG